MHTRKDTLKQSEIRQEKKVYTQFMSGHQAHGEMRQNEAKVQLSINWLRKIVYRMN